METITNPVSIVADTIRRSHAIHGRPPARLIVSSALWRGILESINMLPTVPYAGQEQKLLGINFRVQDAGEAVWAAAVDQDFFQPA